VARDVKPQGVLSEHVAEITDDHVAEVLTGSGSHTSRTRGVVERTRGPRSRNLIASEVPSTEIIPHFRSTENLPVGAEIVPIAPRPQPRTLDSADRSADHGA
jgi:hypothetical protein